MALPNPGMDAVPFTPLTAEFLDNMIENIEALATGTAIAAGAINDTHIAALALKTSKITDPYKFSIYRAAAQTVSTGSVIQFDTKQYDTGTNVDIVTNKGRFTAPVNGFYYFYGVVGYVISANNGTAFGTSVSKNGVVALQGVEDVNMYGGSFTLWKPAGGILQLTAGDYVELVCSATSGGGNAIQTGYPNNFFQGFLVSAA